MSNAFNVGAIGLQAQQRALDTIASNIANVNTPTFKRSEIRFRDVIATRSDADTVTADLAYRPDAMAGVAVDTVWMLNAEGELQQTGRTMDIAVRGAGFIELMGADGTTLLWRGGTMRVNEDGLLSNADGVALKAAISIPQDATAIVIGNDGVVRATVADGGDPVELGQIRLVRLDDVSAAERLDGEVYRVEDQTRLVDAQPGEDGAGQIVQGAIERSNVVLTDEMVQMMLVQRAFSANAQVLQAADQLVALANDLRK